MDQQYTAQVSADVSGYVSSLQQATAVTREFTSASEGIEGAIGRTAMASIQRFNSAIGLTSRLLKTNVSEAAAYQQTLGGVAAKAVAAGRSVEEVSRATKQLARDFTGAAGAAADVVTAVQSIGYTDTANIQKMSELMVQVAAATGEAGGAITQSLQQMSRSMGMGMDPARLRDMSDALVSLTAEFGGSAQAAAQFGAQIAPFADQVGMSTASVTGLSVAFSRMGEAGRRGSTALSTVLSDIDRAVREGSPAIENYALAMGMTTKQARDMAKAAPEDFFVRFVDSISTGGDQAIRTLESIVGEGVRTQKALRELSRSGDLQEMTRAASAAFGDDSTAKSAQEQLDGISESMTRLSESMRQVVANSGAPLLDFMEKLTSASEKVAGATASATDSNAFQSIMAVLGVAGMATGGMGKVLSAGWQAGGLLSMAPMARQYLQPRIGSARDWMRDNRGLMIGGGVAGLAAGSMLGNDMYSMLGLSSLLFASGLGGAPFRFAGGLIHGGMREGNVALQNLPLALRGRQPSLAERVAGYVPGVMPGTAEYDRQMARFGRDRATQPGRVGAALERVPGLGRLVPRSMPGSGLLEVEDTRVYLRKMIDELGDADAKKMFAELSSTVDPRTGRLAMERRIGQMAAAAQSGDPNRWSAGYVATELGAEMAAQQRRNIDTDDYEQQNARRRLTAKRGVANVADFGLAMGSLGRNALMGLSRLAMNPYVLAGGAALAGGAWGVQRVRTEMGLDKQRAERTVEGAAEIAATYGMQELAFRGLQGATERVTNTFEKLTSALEANQELVASESQYRSLASQGDPIAQLRYQNHMFIGDWALGRQSTSAEAVGELLSVFGTQPSARTGAAIAAELKKMGKDEEEYADIAAAWAEVVEGGTRGVMEAAIELYDRRGFGEEDLGSDVIKRLIADNPGMTAEQGLIMFTEALMSSETARGWDNNQMQEAIEAFAVASGVAPESLPDVADVEGNAQSRFESEWTLDAARDVYVNNRTGERVRTDRWGKGNVAYATSGSARPERSVDDVVKQYEQEAVDAILSQVQSSMEARVGLFGSAGQARVASGFGDQMALFSPLGGLVQQQAQYRDFTEMASAEQKEQAFLTGRGPSGEDLVNDPRGAEFLDRIEGFSKRLDGLGLEDAAGQQMAANELIGIISDANAGSSIAAYRDLRLMSGTLSMNTPQGLVAQRAAEVMGARAERQYLGMSPLVATRTRMEGTVGELGRLTALQQRGELGEEGQQRIQELTDQYVQQETQLVQQMQQVYQQRRQFDIQQRYAQEDYQTSVRQSREDFFIQMGQMEEDYQRGVARSERDYNKQRLRAMEDFDRQVSRVAEDAAKSMYDPFQRIALEQTWSGAGLATNLQEQLEMFQRQADSLDSLRGLGLDQSVIDQLGLNDPARAQQAYRLALEAGEAGNEGLIEELNRLAEARQDLAGELFGEENDLGARRMAEDFALQLERMAEDRAQWLSDAQSDYDLSVDRATDSFNRMMDRMADGHRRAMARSREQFTEAYTVFTSDIETLEAGLTNALDTSATTTWPEITSNGIDAITTTFEEKSPEMVVRVLSSVEEAIREEYGADSDLTKVLAELAAVLGVNRAVGGGDGGAGGSAYVGRGHDVPASYEGGGYQVTGGVGRITNPYWAYNEIYKKNRHTGIDIGAPKGTPMYATATGEVNFAQWRGAYGNQVGILEEGTGFLITYAHMDSYGVRPGQQVRKGQFIGTVGNTSSSGKYFGPHVHVEALREPYQYYYDNMPPDAYLYTGGIVNRPGTYMVGEGGPEAVIPFDNRGIDALAAAFDRAFGSRAGAGLPGVAPPMVTTVRNEDHRVVLSGPITVEASDPDAMARALERKARQRALVMPGRPS